MRKEGDINRRTLTNICCFRIYIKKYLEKRVEFFESKYERDISHEDLVLQLEDENAEKLNIANTLRRVFQGSKAYLFVISVMVLLSVFNMNVIFSIEEHYAQKWENVTNCTAGV